VRATVGAVAAKTPAVPDKPAKTPDKPAVAAKTPDKAPDKTPAAPDKLTVAVKTPDKTPGKTPDKTPAVAAKTKEPEPPREKPKAAKTPDISLPDEDKPKKVASADKPAAADKTPSEKPAAAEKGSGADGWLRLGSKPWTNILVDGKDTGLHTPQTHLKLAPGSHRITLTNPQFSIKETFSVDIKAGETETVIKDLRPQGGDSD
jgi:hypothetical protein